MLQNAKSKFPKNCLRLLSTYNRASIFKNSIFISIAQRMQHAVE